MVKLETGSFFKDHDLILRVFYLFYLYIYPPDWQESDRGANTNGKQLPDLLPFADCFISLIFINKNSKI